MKYISLVLLGFSIFWAGCNSSSPAAPQFKDTGVVQIINGDYTFHSTIKFPDGREVEFFHCEANESLNEEGDFVEIQYEGDGSSTGDCATHVSVKSVNSSKNMYGEKIMKGTHQIKGYSELQEEHWITSDGGPCGTVKHTEENWVAYAYHDLSVEHYFTNRQVAENWITDNWCKP